MRRLMSRLPIRWKLTLAFALGLAVVLTAVGVFLHAQLSANVDAAIERDLRMRADQLRELVMRSPLAALPTHSEDLEPDETIAQILAPAGGVVAASSHADVRLLTPEQLQVAATKELFVDRPGDAMLDESLRIFATPVQARGETFIIVVTDSLDERAKTLASALAVEISRSRCCPDRLLWYRLLGCWPCFASGRGAAAAGGSDQRR